MNAANGWISISNLSLAVTSGSYYWLTFLPQSANDIRYQSSGQPANCHVYRTQAYGPLPSAFGTGFVNSTPYVMRATVTSPSNPTTGSTKYSYDTLGNLTRVNDAQGNLSLMTYDWLSRKTSMLDPDMGGWYYDYDRNGNLTGQTDNKGQVIGMVYDALNRLTNKNYPAGSGMADAAYGYDSTSGSNYGKGKRTSMSDYFGANSSTWKYDNRGRLIEETRLIDTYYYTTKYTYDGADRLYQTIYPNPSTTYPTANGETVTQTFNGRGLPYGLSGTQAGSLVTSTLYNGLGALTEINLWNTSGSNRITFGYYGTGGAYDTTGGYYGKLWEIKTTKQTAGTLL